MKRLAVLAIPLFIAACAQPPMGASPPPPVAAAPPAAPVPQPSAEVRNAQQELHTIGLYGGPIDGLYGQETRSAVERFQRSRGLPVTAQLDGRTAAAIHGDAQRMAEPLDLTDPTRVRTVQNRLRQLDFYHGAADGVWGQRTQRALEDFQRARGLPVGDMTRGTLVAMSLDPGGFPIRTASLAEARQPLEPVVVRGTQQRLRDLGFYSGAVDGKWGPATQSALERFQRSRGLEASGSLTPMTVSALGL